MKILGIIWGLSFCRNHGIVEGWNSGFFKGYYPFLIFPSKRFDRFFCQKSGPDYKKI
jgi:hypothetical protein